MLNELSLPVTLDDLLEQFSGHSMADYLKRIEQKLGKLTLLSNTHAGRVRL